MTHQRALLLTSNVRITHQRARSLNQDDHLSYLRDFLAYLLLEQLTLAVHHLLHVGDALVDDREAIANLASYATHVLLLPSAHLLNLPQQLQLRRLQHTIATRIICLRVIVVEGLEKGISPEAPSLGVLGQPLHPVRLDRHVGRAQTPSPRNHAQHSPKQQIKL